MYRRMAVGHDGSDGADRAFRSAIELAHRFAADLHMVSVAELPRFPATIDEVIEEKREENHVFRSLIERSSKEAAARGVILNARVIAGHPVPAIVDFVIAQRIDLLVIGYMGHSALYNRLIGSTTDRLVELAPCAVLVVK